MKKTVLTIFFFIFILLFILIIFILDLETVGFLMCYSWWGLFIFTIFLFKWYIEEKPRR